MNTRIKPLLSVLALGTSLVLTGCGGVKISTPPVSNTGGDSSTPSNPSSAIAAKDFYYHELGDCNQGKQFKYLTAAGFQLWQDPSADIVVGQMSLFLFPEGNYIAQYQEHTNGTKSTDVELTGTFTYQDGKLELSNLGAGETFELNNRFGLSITFTRDIGTAGLQGKAYIFRSTLSNRSYRTENLCPQPS